jgi:hypothetical protein
MNPNTLAEQIEVVTAEAAGKPLECIVIKQKQSPGRMYYWQRPTPGIFNFTKLRYRVKLEPRRFFLSRYPDETVILHKTKHDADFNASGNRVECIEVVEVVR